jgi:hypothetical protein
MVVAVAIFAAAETIFCTASRRFWLNGPSAMSQDRFARGSDAATLLIKAFGDNL